MNSTNREDLSSEILGALTGRGGRATDVITGDARLGGVAVAAAVGVVQALALAHGGAVDW